MSPRPVQFVSSHELQPGRDLRGGQPPASGRPPYGGDEPPFIRLDLIRSLQLHPKLAAAFALGGMVLAAAYVAVKWPVYTAQSVIYIQPLSTKLIENGWTPHWPDDSQSYDSFVAQQVQSASHSDVLINTLHKLKPGVWQSGDESDQAAAGRLGQTIEVARIGTSYEIGITARAKDPEAAAEIANAMAASLVEKVSREEKFGNQERVSILHEEQERVQKELDADRAEQAALDSTLGVAAVGAQAPDHYDDEISRVHEELVRARTAHDDAAARLISLDADRDGSLKALNAQADELIATDPGMASLKMSLNQRRAALTSQMANLTPNHPQYKQAVAELAQIDLSLDTMTRDLRAKASSRIQQRLRTELDRSAGVEQRLNVQLGQLAAAAGSAAPKMQRANDLGTDIIRLQGRVASVDEQMHNLILENSVPGAARLSTPAEVPQFPTVSGIARKALPLALSGVLLGLLATLVVYNLDQRIYVAADVRHALGIAPMAQLPDFSEVSDGVADEHLLRLSATIEHAYRQGSLKSCLLTATGAGAGVTTVVNRMCSMLESMGRPTVLVDATWTPPLHPGETSRGLRPAESSSQLITQRGSRSTALLQQLAGKSDGDDQNLIITDSAPIAVSAETEYLTRFVDAAIVVIESGVTTRTQLREVATSLQRLDVAAVGFVLNRVGLEKADSSFRNSVRNMERFVRYQDRSFKKDLDDMQKQKKLQIASEPESPIPPVSVLPKPETHVFYLPAWKARNPLGDVEAAKSEAIRQGFEVVER